MYAITIAQPWASAIIDGYKDVESRDFPPVNGYSGTLYIHSSQVEPTTKDIELFQQLTGIKYSEKDMPRGVILGSVQLTNVIENSQSKWALPDNLHWVLNNPIKFENPIKERGSKRCGNICTPHKIEFYLLNTKFLVTLKNS